MRGEGQRLSGMAWIYDFLPTRRFPDLCLNVYFSENHSEYDFITVNGGLYSLFTDYAAQISPEDKKEYQEYARMCRTNLETSLSNLPLHLPASADVIVALLFGVSQLSSFVPHAIANYTRHSTPSRFQNHHSHGRWHPKPQNYVRLWATTERSA